MLQHFIYRSIILIFLSLLFFTCVDEEVKAIEKSKHEILIETVDSIYGLAIKGFSHSLRDKGIFRYSFDPVHNKYSTKNNAIRQLMATRLMAELAGEEATWLPKHKKNLNFLMKHWYKVDNDSVGYILYNDKSKLGANAMFLRALTVSPFYEDYQDIAKQLCSGILMLMDDDGDFDPFYKEPSYTYDKDYLLTFYSGEALVSLIEYAVKIDNDDLLKMAIKSQDHYIQKYVTELDKNYYPAYVPWHTISLSKLYKLTGDKKYSDAIFTLNDKLLEIQDTTSHIGRFYNYRTPQYGKPHGSSDGVYTEGLAYAYEIALLENDSIHRSKYLRALKMAMVNLKSLQYSKDDCKDVKFPERCTGAFRTSTTNPWSRVDTGQHILDALRKLLSIEVKKN